jgi:CHAT domain-containing protein
MLVFCQAKADGYYNTASEYYEKQQYDSAVVYIDLAIEGYEIAGIYDTLVDAYGAKAQYILMGKGPDSSIAFLDRIEAKVKTLFPDIHESWIEIYYQYANAYEVKGDYKTGIQNIEKLLDIINKAEVPISKQARSYSIAARVYQGARNHKEGIQYGKLAKDLFLEAYPDTTNSYYAVLNTLAGLYLFNSQYDSSINYSLQYLQGVKEIYGQDHFNVGVGYNQIAGIHYNLNRYDRAIHYFEKAEDVFQKYYAKTGQDIYVNIIRTNLSLVYIDLMEYELAREYALGVWPADIRNYGPTSPKLLYTLGRLVTIYHGLDDLESAEIYVDYIRDILRHNPEMTPSNKCYALNFILNHSVRQNDLSSAEKAFDQYRYWYEKSGEAINKTYIATISKMAEIYVMSGELNKGIEMHKDAIDMYVEIFPRQSNAVFREYLAISNSLNKTSPEEASYYLDSAMQKRIYPNTYISFEDAIKYCSPSPLIIEAIISKLKLLSDHPDLFNNSEKSINSITKEYESFIEAYFMIIRTQSRISDLADDNDVVFSYAIKNLLNQGDTVSAFEYAEKNRALSIRLALNQIESHKYLNVPERILIKESNYTSNINRYLIEKYNPAISDSARDAARMRYNDALNNYLSLTKEIRNSYPEYYRLKYGLPDIDLKKIRDQLNETTVILSYKFIEDELYLFHLNKKDLSIVKLNEDDLNEEIKELYTQLNKGKYNDSLAHSIYNVLWKPIHDKVKKEVIVIPDRSIHYLSFDLLKNENGQYLIRDHTISYAIAADLLMNNNPELQSSKWVAFAPGFQDSLKQNYIEKVNGPIDSTYLSYLPQPWTVNFTKELEDLGTAVVYHSSDASDYHFKKNPLNTPFLFIGTHAEFDDQRPNYSKLVFAKSGKEEQFDDGYLHSYEIYGKRINTGLAILTACNTGVGQLRNGEGMISISHSFSYAGCPSIVMTKWAVDEKSSIELIKLFTGKLNDGLPKNTALREAKLEYIKENPELGKNPYYWAGLSLLGDTAAIHQHVGYPDIVIISITICIILLVFILLKKFIL